MCYKSLSTDRAIISLFVMHFYMKFIAMNGHKKQPFTYKMLADLNRFVLKALTSKMHNILSTVTSNNTASLQQRKTLQMRPNLNCTE